MRKRELVRDEIIIFSSSLHSLSLGLILYFSIQLNLKKKDRVSKYKYPFTTSTTPFNTNNGDT